MFLGILIPIISAALLLNDAKHKIRINKPTTDVVYKMPR